eukprot:m.256444 g.256444  ORF g.256444 m.256444 type:complete len:219 (-) comp19171_c4_seq6:99-755(-)
MQGLAAFHGSCMAMPRYRVFWFTLWLYDRKDRNLGLCFTFVASADSGTPMPSTCKVERSTVDMEENGVRLKLTVIDTPGFGDAVNNTGCWQPIVKDIEQAFEQYMDDESRLHRGTVRDSRVHCCLYFIAPSGHRLKPLDIQVMKALQHKVNLVPVIAKADSLTEEECAQFKAKIVADIDREGINVFGFQNDDDDDDDAFLEAAEQSDDSARNKRSRVD